MRPSVKRRSKKGRSENFVPVGQVLASLMKGLGLEEKLRERELIENWPRIIGPEIARFSQALRVRGGVLYLKVDSPAWGQELHFLKPQLLERVNESCGGDLIHDIRLSGR